MDINILADPRKLVFESDNDVIDYVTKSIIPPTTKNFKMVMNALQDYSANPVIEGENPVRSYTVIGDGKSGNVDITIRMENIDNPDVLKDCMERVHKNRVANMKRVLIGAGIVSILIVGGHVKMIKKRNSVSIHDGCDDRHMLIGGEMCEIDIPPEVE